MNKRIFFSEKNQIINLYVPSVRTLNFIKTNTFKGKKGDLGPIVIISHFYTDNKATEL